MDDGRPRTRRWRRGVFASATRATSTCSARAATPTLIDFGSGLVLDRLAELGVDRITDVLLTHHHRDQVQGLRARGRGRHPHLGAAGRAWTSSPASTSTGSARQLDNDYDLRAGPLLAARAGAGRRHRRRVPDARAYGGVEVHTLPTPGHTIGSVTYLVERDGRRLAFTGDLVYGDGQGLVARGDAVVVQRHRGRGDDVLSCGVLAGERRTCCCPSHGEPIDDPPRALALRARPAAGARRPAARAARGTSSAGCERRSSRVTPHLLRNRTMPRQQLRAALRDGRARC